MVADGEIEPGDEFVEDEVEVEDSIDIEDVEDVDVDVEIDEEMKASKENSDKVKEAKVEDLDESTYGTRFDLIYSTHVLEHIYNLHDFMEVILKNLNPMDGYALQYRI